MVTRSPWLAVLDRPTDRRWYFFCTLTDKKMATQSPTMEVMGRVPAMSSGRIVSGCGGRFGCALAAPSAMGAASCWLGPGRKLSACTAYCGVTRYRRVAVLFRRRRGGDQVRSRTRAGEAVLVPFLPTASSCWARGDRNRDRGRLASRLHYLFGDAGEPVST